MKIVEQGVYYITQKPEKDVTMLQEFDEKFGWQKTHDRVLSTKQYNNPFDFSSRFRNVESNELVAKEYVRVVTAENKAKLDDLRENYVIAKAKQKHIFKNSKNIFAITLGLSVVTFLVLSLLIMFFVKNDTTSTLNVKNYLYGISGLVSLIPLIITYIVKVIKPKRLTKSFIKAAKAVLKEDSLIDNEFLVKDGVTLSVLAYTNVLDFKGDTFYVPSGISKISTRELPIYSEENVIEKNKFYKYFYIPKSVEFIEGEFAMTPTNIWPVAMLIFESDNVILSDELQQQIKQKMINVVFNIPKSSVDKLIKNLYI